MDVARPSGPICEACAKTDPGVVAPTRVGVFVDVLRVDEDGVNAGLGVSRPGIDGRGVRTSVYISRRMLDNPTVAEGWSQK